MELTFSPNLTLDTPVISEEEILTPTVEEVSQICKELAQLTETEQAMVKNFSEQIDLNNSGLVMQYGAAAQKHVADFSTSTLNNVRTKNMGDVGGMLSTLTVELQGLNFDEEEKRGIRGIFRRAQNHIATLKAQFDNAEANVDKIVTALEKHQVTLLRDIALLDKMHELNQNYFKELTMYILAGKKRIQDVQNNDLVILQKKAVESGLPEDAEATNDLVNRINRFEKKVHDLELTRMVSIQMSPQIRMIQNNDALMLEKIQSSIVNTIPLWRSQMVMALSMQHSQQAMQAQRSVTDMTNELLIKNAQKLQQTTVDIARESERGIVDMETLRETNRFLIETLDEVREIQVQGSLRRAEASDELVKIESELKERLIRAVNG